MGDERTAGTTQDEGLERVVASYRTRVSRIVDLNLFRLRLSSNVADFKGFDFFTDFAEGAEEAPADYELTCVDLDEDPVETDLVARLRDRTFRGDRFANGFYLTHHWGPPAYLVTRGNHIRVFGRQLERTVWPYFVKHLLTIYAADHDVLHLKASGFEHRGHATLLFGRGGGGKTVFTTQACRAGAAFLANTHVLLDERTAYGVGSTMRVRDDACFGELIAGGSLDRHLERGEYVVDPRMLFDRVTRRADVRNLCVVDYDPRTAPELTEVPAAAFSTFLEMFSLPIGTYGLKDDLLAHVGGDFGRFVAAYDSMRRRLDDLVRGSRLYRVNVDMLDPAQRDHVMAELARS
jgi:hypothetical protein